MNFDTSARPRARFCTAGACKRQTCTPESTYCEGGNVYKGDAGGMAVAVTGGSFRLYDLAPWSLDGLSFGNPIGGIAFYYQSNIGGDFGPDRLYQMSVTTELP